VATSPLVNEILRNMFSFLVRVRMLDEAVALSKEIVKIFLNAEAENSAFKILAAVTVIQLTQGDPVKVRKTVFANLS
jgi:hypothetical protein